jgi:hypothetical protein
VNRRQFLAGVGVFSQTRLSKRFLLDEADNPVIQVHPPYLQNVRSDRATVMWSTQYPGSGWIEYSSDGVNFKRVTAQARMYPRDDLSQLLTPFNQYTARIPRLTPNTTYIYRAIVDGQLVGQVSTFTTAGPGPFRFLVLGDSGMGTNPQARIALSMAQETASFVIHVGDIAYGNGNFQQFLTNYFGYYSDTMSRMPFFTTPGNHEYMTPDARAYFALHSFPTETVPLAEHGHYYSFDWGNAHFVSLDSTKSLRAAMRGESDLFNWLQRDLRSTRQFWKIVFFHHPPYAGGRNVGDPNEIDAKVHLPLRLEENGVQLVLTGHEHSYQRTFDIRSDGRVPEGTGTIYVTSGGGGATLYPEVTTNPIPQVQVHSVVNQYMRMQIDGSRLYLQSISDRGAEVDNLVIAPKPVLAESSRVLTFDPAPRVGALIYVRGFNLASEETFAQAMLTNLSGTILRINGRSIPLIYVSPTQIVGQLPVDVSGAITLSVATENGMVTAPFTV